MNRSEYIRRLNQVLDHINLHLDTSLDLPELADVANFRHATYLGRQIS